MSALRRFIVLAVVCAAAATFFAFPAAGFDLVKGGKAAATIVIPAQPLPIESYAAQELQYHVKASSGVELPILSEDSVILTGGRVYLGHCKATAAANIDPSAMPGNGYVVKAEGGNLFIAGKDTAGDPLSIDTRAGTLFCVYDILENNLGVRWLWPGKLGEVIPARKTITIPDLNAKVEPALWFNNFGAAGGGGRKASQSTAVPNAQEKANQQAVWGRRHRAGRNMVPSVGHSFGNWWDRFGKTHPEYFRMLPNGKRELYVNYDGEPVDEQYHMCVSCPGLVDQIIADWKAKGMGPYINVCENDSWGGCACPNCLAWDEPIPGHPEVTPNYRTYTASPVPFNQRLEAAKKTFDEGGWWMLDLGQLSDRYAKFWKAVSEKARESRPDVIVGAYIYDNYRKAPVGNVKLSHNVMAGVVTWAYFPYNKDVSSTFQQDWDGWYKTGCLLFLRPNFGNFGHDLPFIYSHEIGNDLKFAMARGMKGNLLGFTSEYAMQGPNAYVISKMLSHPEMTVDQALDEFYSGFGPAKKTIKAYFDHFEAASQRFSTSDIDKMVVEKKRYGMAQHVDIILETEMFTPQIMAKGEQLLDTANKQAAGDPVASARIDWLAKGLKQGKLSLATEIAYEHAIDIGDPAGFKAAYKTLADWRASQSTDDFFSSPSRLARAEDTLWLSKTSPLSHIDGSSIKTLRADWKFTFDEAREGESLGWQAAGFDESSWRTVEAGVTWEKNSAGKAWSAANSGKIHGTGDGWYRMTLPAQKLQPSQRLVLVFGQVNDWCKAWVNGKELSGTPTQVIMDEDYQCAPFELDLTDAASSGKPLAIAVKVTAIRSHGGMTLPAYLVVR